MMKKIILAALLSLASVQVLAIEVYYQSNGECGVIFEDGLDAMGVTQNCGPNGTVGCMVHHHISDEDVCYQENVTYYEDDSGDSYMLEEHINQSIENNGGLDKKKLDAR